MDYEYILLHVDKPLFRYDFHSNHPLILEKHPEFGLKSIFLWYTYPNISEKYNNNKIKITCNGLENVIVMPKGMYEISALSEYLNNQVNECFASSGERVILGVNESTFECFVRLRDGIKLDFTQGNLYKLLGLEPKIYDKPYEEGTNIINITRGVDRLFIRCNLVERRYQPEMKDVLFDILPFAQPGSAIQENAAENAANPSKFGHIAAENAANPSKFGHIAAENAANPSNSATLRQKTPQILQIRPHCNLEVFYQKHSLIQFFNRFISPQQSLF